jgi:beta-phosphoglucomutase-like phosphatase (HAD superfamily)
MPDTGHELFKGKAVMLPKGILFDLDDTLIAFDAVANPAWQQLCDTYACRAALDDPMTR